MSRTGSIADGPAVTAAEAPAARTRVPAKRLEPEGGALPGFSQHVLMLERSADEPLAGGRPLAMGMAVEPKGDEALGPQSDAEGTKHAVAAPRLTDALQEAMLLLEQAQPVRDVPASALSADESSSVLSEAENVPPPGPPILKPRIWIAPVARGGAEANAVLIATRTTPLTEPSVDRATAREAASNAPIGSLKHRDVQPDRSGKPDQLFNTTQRARQLRETGPGRALNRAEDVPVKVVRQETHLAPVQRLSPLAQIAEIVAEGLGETDEAQSVRNQTHPSFANPTAGTVIRVLSIRLEPAELGTVNIRLRLEANALELQLDAQKSSTAELIRRDQGALTGLLRSAGYDVEGLIVQLGDADRSFTGSAPQSPPHFASAQAQSGWSQPDGRPGGAHPQDHRSHDPGGRTAAASGKEPTEPEAGPLRPRGVYV